MMKSRHSPEPNPIKIEPEGSMIEFAIKTRKGFIPVGPETGFKQKQNQDAHIEIEKFCGVDSIYFFGVYDGHGINGKKVSNFVKSKLPHRIE